MANVLNNGISGLLSYQRALSTTGHNIANADTVGYSRQRTLFTAQTPQNMGAGWMGNGVRVLAVERQYNDFLATQTRNTQSAASNLEVFSNYAANVDSMMADPIVGLDPAIQGFFNSVQEVAKYPVSISARTQMLSETQAMVDRFHYLNGQLESQRDQANRELAVVTMEINGLASSIAEVNQNIVEAIGVSGGAEPNDLLDRRETLLNDLSKLVDIKVVPQDDGALNVFLGKGQAMVMGSNVSTLGLVPNADDPGKREVVFTDTVGSQAITQYMTGGEIGGLLSFQEQILDPAQNRLGLIAVGISDQINQQHKLGIDLNSNPGGSLFKQSVNEFNQPVIEVSESSQNNPASTVSVKATLTDAGHLTASDYKLKADDDAGNFTLTRLSDGQAWSVSAGATPFTADGFSITIDSGSVQLGDEFLILPTRNAARDLALEITDPEKLAAAGFLRSEVTGNADGPNLGNASVSQPTVSDVSTLDTSTNISMVYDATNKQFQLNVDMDGDGNPDTLAYDPATDSGGKSFQLLGNYGDPTFSISDDPQDGDSFLITFNRGGVGDNRNALQLAQMQHEKTMLGSSSNNELATFQDVYGLLVADVGTKTRTSQMNSEATDGLLEHHKMAMSSVSGVNLDEEAADLIRYQQAYQASAQVISTANNMFNTLLGAIRG